MSKKKVKTPLIFKVDDKTYRVKQKKWGQKKFKPDCAYLLSEINSYVYPFRGEIDNKEYAFLPGIYLYNDETLVIRPSNDTDKLKYNKNNIIALTPDSIFEDLTQDVEPISDVIITDGDVFKPEIRGDEDILLQGLKYCLSNKNDGKGINFNTYGNRFTDVATKNNARRAITHGETLKMSMASRYGKVFDINIMAGFWDKDGCKNPINSDEKTLYIIFNDEEIDLKDPNLKIKVITRE